MDEVTIACIVEGHGDARAVPVLLRRIADELSVWRRSFPPPQRVNKSELVRPGVLENTVQAAAHRVPGAGGILVLLDADDDLPCELGPQLRERARIARPDKNVAVVLANKEFEAWFLASAASLAGHRNLPPRLEPPSDPETIRGAKQRLSRMTGQPYKETVDQAALASIFDMKTARQNSPSFDKFRREVERLLGR
jgi:hypothetical protein